MKSSTSSFGSHGWRSRTEHMRLLIEGFRAAGLRVIAIDLPGHGKSSGRRLHLANAVARAQAADVDAGLAAGADAYVTKPFSPRELAAQVDALLQSAR